MEWRESDGVRWLEADLGGGARRLLDPASAASASRPSTRLNLGVLTDDAATRWWPRTAGGSPRRLGSRPGADPDRPPGPRRRPCRSTPARQRAEPVRASRAARLPEVDGHVVAEPGLAPLVFTADCLPVALAGPGGVAMLHCGWRGLAAGIVAAGAEAVGATDAAIGPGIGPCCYEVGDEVLDAFAEPRRRRVAAMGRMLDLARGRPRGCCCAAGVERVESAGLCTSCEPELFFSHRRDAGRTGRQGGLVWIEPGGLSGRADPRHRAGQGRGQPGAGARDGRRGGRDPRRLQVRAAGGDGGAGRGRGGAWSARTASRTSPPSTSAGATPSSGTSSATCRAAR